MTGEARAATQDIRLTWRPTAHANRLASLALLALLLPVLLGRPALVALAAPPLCLLAAGLGERPPRRVTVQAGFDAGRCLEDEPVTVTVRVVLPRPVDQLDIELDPGPTVRIAEGEPRVSLAGTAEATAEWIVRPSAGGAGRSARYGSRCGTRAACSAPRCPARWARPWSSPRRPPPG